MEEYIFIILAILLSVFSAFNRNKNKNASGKTAAGSSSGTGTSFFDQFFGETFGLEEEPAPKQTNPVVPEPIKRPIQKNIKKIREPFLTGEMAQASRRKDLIVLQKTIDAATVPSHPRKHRMPEMMKGFSLKKAVVYSEIIRPKYIE